VVETRSVMLDPGRRGSPMPSPEAFGTTRQHFSVACFRIPDHLTECRDYERAAALLQIGWFGSVFAFTTLYTLVFHVRYDINDNSCTIPPNRLSQSACDLYIGSTTL